MGIKSLNARNSGFVLKIASLERTIRDNMKSLETFFVTFSHEFSALAEKLKDDKLAPKEKAAMISNKVSEMKTRNYSMGRQVEDVKKKLSVVENQNSNYVTELREKNTYIDKNPAQICELKENFKKSERKSTALEEKVKRLEIEKAASEENFTALSAENSRALEEKIEKLEREKAASDDALAKLTAALHVK